MATNDRLKLQCAALQVQPDMYGSYNVSSNVLEYLAESSADEVHVLGKTVVRVKRSPGEASARARLSGND